MFGDDAGDADSRSNDGVLHDGPFDEIHEFGFGWAVASKAKLRVELIFTSDLDGRERKGPE